MSRYAAKTTVPVEQSRRELEKTLQRYGAEAFSYGYDAERAVVMFQAGGRRIRFELTTPPLSDFTFTPSGIRRNQGDQQRAREQAVRQQWRALSLVVKAKLEAVASDLVTFEQEFLAHILLPDGGTVGQWAGPQLAEVYATGQMPAVLPGAPARALPPGGGDA